MGGKRESGLWVYNIRLYFVHNSTTFTSSADEPNTVLNQLPSTAPMKKRQVTSPPLKPEVMVIMVRVSLAIHEYQKHVPGEKDVTKETPLSPSGETTPMHTYHIHIYWFCRY